MILKDMKNCKWNGNDINKLIWNNNVLWEKNSYKGNLIPNIWTSLKPTGTSIDKCAACSYHGEIYRFGGYNDQRSFYKLNNADEWVRLGDMPYNFYDGNAIVYNDEIHILGGSGAGSNHYILNTSDNTWTKPNITNQNKSYSVCCVYNDEIHFLNYIGDHYKIDKNTNTVIQVDSIGYYVSSGYNLSGFVVYNDELVSIIEKDMLRLDKNTNKWIHTTIPLPYNFIDAGCVVYHDEIHILGSNTSNYNCVDKHYKLEKNTNTWCYIGTIPIAIGRNRSSVIVHNDEIHIIGGFGLPEDNNHFAIYIPK